MTTILMSPTGAESILKKGKARNEAAPSPRKYKCITAEKQNAFFEAYDGKDITLREALVKASINSNAFYKTIREDPKFAYLYTLAKHRKADQAESTLMKMAIGECFQTEWLYVAKRDEQQKIVYQFNSDGSNVFDENGHLLPVMELREKKIKTLQPNDSMIIRLLEAYKPEMYGKKQIVDMTVAQPVEKPEDVKKKFKDKLKEIRAVISEVEDETPKAKQEQEKQQDLVLV